MNYTEKYHLPQWEKTDRILMDDFNQMCADLEAGLEKNARDAAAAMTAAVSAPTSAAVSKAQATADTAVSKADAARAVADNAYCPSFKPYVTGTYTGIGLGHSISVEVGFKPLFLIITGQSKGAQNSVTYAALVGEEILSDVVTFTSTGFTIQAQKYYGTISDQIVNINDDNRLYRYFAFR